MQKYNAFVYTGFVAGVLLLATNASASERAVINQFKKLLSEQAKQLTAQQKTLDAQNRQLNELQSRLDQLLPLENVTNTAATTAQNKNAKPEQSPATVAQAPKQTAEPQKSAPVQTRLKEMPKDTKPPEIPRVSADVGGVLTPKGRLVVEPTIQYGYSKAQRVAVVGFNVAPVLIGNVDVRDVRHETETVALTGRYGLTERLELEARVPFSRRQETSQTRPIIDPSANDTFFNASGTDIGDIELAGHYQINKGLNGWPFLIGNLRVKTVTGTSPFEVPINLKYNLPEKLNTGSGFWSIQPSITAIFPTDPAVFYANVNYLMNIGTSVPQQTFLRLDVKKDPEGKVVYTTVPYRTGGKVDPGDAIGFSFGTSLAYNEKASFSLGYSHTIYFKSKQNGVNIDGTDIDIGQFTFGLNYAFTKKTSANLSVAVGATRDAPDVQLTLRIPYGIDI